jgi:chemotaxis response regulator CheB
MGAGALDAVNTPVLEHPGTTGGARALLGKIETIRRLVGDGRSSKLRAKHKPTVGSSEHTHQPLVTIGASAGGPAALSNILSQMPEDFPAPIVIIQHVDVKFAHGLAEWLGHQSKLEVRLAADGATPTPGTVLLPGKSSHLVFVSSNQLSYTRYPEDTSCHPSIDVFLKSVEQHWPGDVVGVLLTGMGRDGAEGLLALRGRGHHTIAQDQASSAVYGMPKAAAELKAATEILPLDKIAPRIRNIVAQKSYTHA